MRGKMSIKSFQKKKPMGAFSGGKAAGGAVRLSNWRFCVKKCLFFLKFPRERLVIFHRIVYNFFW